MQMANKEIRCLKLLVKTTAECYTITEKLKSKMGTKLTISSTNEDAEQQEPTYVASVNENWYNYCGKQFCNFLWK